jgi:hypothetical protein
MKSRALNAVCSWNESGPVSASFTVPVKNAYLAPPHGLFEGAWVELEDAPWEGEVVSVRPSVSESGEHSLAVECAGLQAIAAKRNDLVQTWTHYGPGLWVMRPGANDSGTYSVDNGAVTLSVPVGTSETINGADPLSAVFVLHDELSDQEICQVSYGVTWDAQADAGVNWGWYVYAAPSLNGTYTTLDTQSGNNGGLARAYFTPPAGTKVLRLSLFAASAYTTTAVRYVNLLGCAVFSSGRTSYARLDEAMVDVMTRPGLCTSVTSRRIGPQCEDLSVGEPTNPTNAAAAVNSLADRHSQPVKTMWGLGRIGKVEPYLWTPDNPAKVIVVGGGRTGLKSWEVAEYDEDVPEYAEVIFGNKDSAAYPEGWPRRLYRPGTPPDDNCRVTPVDLSQFILTDAAAAAAGDNLVGHVPSEIPPDYIFRVHADRVRQGKWPGRNDDLLGRASVQDTGPGRAVGTLTGAAFTYVSGYSGSGSPADPSCIVLDGTGDYVTFGDLATLDLGVGARTVTGWVQFSSVASNQAIFGKLLNSGAYTGWECRLEPDGKLSAVACKDLGATQYRAGKGATVLAASTWYHVAFVYAGSGGDWTIYVNGVAESMTASGAAGAWDSDNTTIACIGSRAGAALALAGSVNSVTAYSRALSAAEIAQDYSAGMVIYDRSYAKGNVLLEKTCVNRLGAPVRATDVTTDDYWIQNLDEGSGRPLRITGTNVDLKARRNALTIGEDWMEEELGLRNAELMALPETVVVDPETGDPVDPDPWRYWRVPA